MTILGILDPLAGKIGDYLMLSEFFPFHSKKFAVAQ